MRALVYDDFKEVPDLRDVPTPEVPERGVVVKVHASGMCRSDWHGWNGHDPMITPPHVPGHELAGVVTDLGMNVENWSTGERVTVPFVGGCGRCTSCAEGQPQVCPNQFQPGFSEWGSFAEFVAVDYADKNLVRIPEGVDMVTASILGCRFGTAFRAIVDQGNVSAGEWVAVHGCGGVGLSCIMIAKAVGANVIAVDVADGPLNLAAYLGASVTVNARDVDNVSGTIRDRTGGGTHVSIDAVGDASACFESVSCLRKQGMHIQAGLLVGTDRNTPVPFDRVVADELEIRGTHGIQAYRYPAIFGMITAGSLAPEKLVKRKISLEEAGSALMGMEDGGEPGIQVITNFG